MKGGRFPADRARCRGSDAVAAVGARGSLDAMTGQVRLTIRYLDAGDGWVTAQIAEIPAAISEGRTRAEARANVLDALQDVLTPDEESIGRQSDHADSDSLTLTYTA